MRVITGPDLKFPYLDEHTRFEFPNPDESDSDSIISWGGNLSPGMLLSAYEQGLFPWYDDESPVLWHSPDPRFVLFPDDLHISESMKKVFRKKTFEITYDNDFRGVITNCAKRERPGQDGTWITGDMIEAYCVLHSLGIAHSAESWVLNSGNEKVLAGGCYGLRLGKVFFGESMFALEKNASKAAFLTMAQALFNSGVLFIDCQVHTDHLESLGAREISRTEYLKLLKTGLKVFAE
jgi:leucyl/phenylalanyl-tRNA--protein transferase